MEDQSKSATADTRPRLWAYVLVFIAGFCLMVIELVASRIVAPYLGSSLYTWTGVIGVVLLGIAIGNYVGGILAELGADRRGLGLIFIIAAVAAIVSFYLSKPAAEAIKTLQPPLSLGILFFSLLEFFPVSLFLSMVTPIVISLSLKSLQKTGTTVGRIYAVSSAASILGTFVTGFVLIPLLGVKTIVLCVAAVLLLAGLALCRGTKLIPAGPLTLLLLLLWSGLFMPRFCTSETAYYCLRLKWQVNQEGLSQSLVLDKLVHSHVFSDPRRLGYEYEDTYAIVAEYAAARSVGAPLRALFIGGGGYVMPRFMEEVYPDSELTVAEIDPGVTDIAIQRLGLNPLGSIKTVNEDARLFLTDHADGQVYDLVFGDAYADIAVPFHLTTEEFFGLVRGHLAPGGIYALNIIDAGDYGRVLASFMRTASRVFPYVEVATMNPQWRDYPWRTTFVLLASDEPLDRQEWLAAAERVFSEKIARPALVTKERAQYLMTDAEKTEFLSGHKGLVLTDNYVPIDSLLTPLFRDIY